MNINNNTTYLKTSSDKIEELLNSFNKLSYNDLKNTVNSENKIINFYDKDYNLLNEGDKNIFFEIVNEFILIKEVEFVIPTTLTSITEISQENTKTENNYLISIEIVVKNHKNQTPILDISTSKYFYN